jgi:hypothetical protein
MLGLATTSSKTLKLIVPKDYISHAKIPILNYIVFSILPKNTKKKKKVVKKYITNMLPTTITINDKVFSILPKKHRKNTQKSKPHTKKDTKTKKHPKTKTKTIKYKTIVITHNPPQYKVKTKTTKILFKSTKTHHYLKNKLKNKKINSIRTNIKRKKNNAKPK